MMGATVRGNHSQGQTTTPDSKMKNSTTSVTKQSRTFLSMILSCRLVMFLSLQKLVSAFFVTHANTCVRRHHCIPSPEQRFSVSILRASVTRDSLTERDSNPRASDFVCHSCQENFASRNALFRHLQTNNECGEKAGTITKGVCKQSIAIQFAYYHDTEHVDMFPLSFGNDHLALLSGKILEQCLVEIIDGSGTVQVVSRTQSSITRLRPETLEQEPDTASTGDVLVLNMKIPESLRTTLTTSKKMNEFLSNLQDKLDQAQPPGRRIMVGAIKLLSEGQPLHAERSCTQVAYQYLLPFEWLPEAEALHNWAANDFTPSLQTESLRVLKQALRSAESKQLDYNIADKEPPSQHNTRTASGRFGALAQRERRAWHNYSSKRMSPNHDTAWRVIDRCRIVGFVNGHVIIEARGDEFLQGQFRAIVGTAVAITNGWLPQDVIQKTTNKDLVVAMPLAPTGRTYLADVKFHFDEMRSGGKSVFESSVGGSVFVPKSIKLTAIEDEIRLGMLKRLSTTKVQNIERQWMRRLKEEASPTALSRLLKMTDTVDSV